MNRTRNAAPDDETRPLPEPQEVDTDTHVLHTLDRDALKEREKAPEKRETPRKA